jgi:deoxyadenosine/deoxycytidine kinase
MPTEPTTSEKKTSDKKFIAIAGNMGAGKSTLTELVAKHYRWTPVFESADANPYLADFFGDMARWAFNHQMFFLIDRFRQHRSILASEKSAVQDRTIYEDAEIFAQNLYDMSILSRRDFATYKSLYDEFVKLLTPPDLVVYLQASIPKIVHQVDKRGRDYENKVQLEYLKRLEAYYETWYDRYNRGKKILINVDDLDFLERESDLNYAIQRIDGELFGLFS